MHPNAKTIAPGTRINRLVVRYMDGKIGARVAFLCDCDCGGTKRVTGTQLREGKVKSCGCILVENALALRGRSAARKKELATYHWQSPTYSIWVGMKRRCTDASRSEFKNYGARGIKVCKRWLIYENFLADMGERPEGMSIDRINVDGDYEPNNCKWATASEQALNRRPRRKSTA